MANSSLNRFSVVEALNVRESSQWMPYCNNGDQYQLVSNANNNVDVTQFSRILVVVNSAGQHSDGSFTTVIHFTSDPLRVVTHATSQGEDGSTGNAAHGVLRLVPGIHVFSIPKFVNQKTYFGWVISGGQWIQNFILM